MADRGIFSIPNTQDTSPMSFWYVWDHGSGAFRYAAYRRGDGRAKLCSTVAVHLGFSLTRALVYLSVLHRLS